MKNGGEYTIAYIWQYIGEFSAVKSEAYGLMYVIMEVERFLRLV